MADKKGSMFSQVPSAPNATQQFQQDPNLFHRAPPPSYEESQRYQNPNPQTSYAPQTSNYFPNMSGNPPPYAGVHMPMQYASQPGMMMPINASINPQFGYNYNAPQQQIMPGTAILSQQQSSSPMTVTFDAGARFKGQGAGSISVPPPPPGCAPTPEQLAALQGQPVMLNKKKKSFF